MTRANDTNTGTQEVLGVTRIIDALVWEIGSDKGERERIRALLTAFAREIKRASIRRGMVNGYEHQA